MTTPDTQQSDKEYNFRALEAKLQHERAERERLQRELEERQAQVEDDSDDDEPYIDTKKLTKTLQKHGQATQTEIKKAMDFAKTSAKEELKQEMWLEAHADFQETLKNAEKFAQQNPQLAETILRMPEGFERQKLVYQNIKALRLDQPEEKKPSIQDTIDARRQGGFYQPSGVGAAPYSTQSDFSPAGQKDAYQKMQDLKNRLRLG